MNGKGILKLTGAILCGLAATATVLNSKNESSAEPIRAATGYATYSMVIASLMRRREITSFYKEQIIAAVPKTCDNPDLYSAAISVIEDNSMTSFYKLETIKKLFVPSD